MITEKDEKTEKAERIAAINKEIHELQEQLKSDLSAVHEDKLKEIQQLLEERKGLVEHG